MPNPIESFQNIQSDKLRNNRFIFLIDIRKRKGLKKIVRIVDFSAK